MPDLSNGHLTIAFTLEIVRDFAYPEITCDFWLRGSSLHLPQDHRNLFLGKRSLFIAIPPRLEGCRYRVFPVEAGLLFREDVGTKN